MRNLKLRYVPLRQQYSLLTIDEQSELRKRIAQIIGVGCAVVFSSFWYSSCPMLIRVFLIPVAVLGSWILAGTLDTKFDISNKVLKRLSQAPTLGTLGAFFVVAFTVAGLVWGASR